MNGQDFRDHDKRQFPNTPRLQRAQARSMRQRARWMATRAADMFDRAAAARGAARRAA
jgi:hypothetical protein